jgi:hypothetical protein
VPFNELFLDVSFSDALLCFTKSIPVKKKEVEFLLLSFEYK